MPEFLHAAFVLNKNKEKSMFDYIRILKNTDDDLYEARVYYDQTTVNLSNPYRRLTFRDHEDVLEYIRYVQYLLKADEDITPYHSMDVMLTGFPTINMTVRNLDTSLISRCMCIIR